jgi:hypothetical protein
MAKVGEGSGNRGAEPARYEIRPPLPWGKRRRGVVDGAAEAAFSAAPAAVAVVVVAQGMGQQSPFGTLHRH